jgi:hypothetical protein
MRSAEGAELNDAVCSVVAHELGGIAGALDLRAVALSRTIPPNDVAALRSLAEELRASTRAVRLMRGTDASGTLNPTRQQTLSDWWRLASRLSRVILPGGTTLNATFDESRLNPGHGPALTLIWLCACKELAEMAAGNVITVTLRGDSEAETTHLMAESPGLGAPGGQHSRWSEHAAKVATSIEAAAPRWESVGGIIQWSFSLPAAQK